jgi:hypothetical protein
MIPPDDGKRTPSLTTPVVEQAGDDAGQQERQPDGRPRHCAGLAQEGEDAGADQGADAEERGPRNAHAAGFVSRSPARSSFLDGHLARVSSPTACGGSIQGGGGARHGERR